MFLQHAELFVELPHSDTDEGMNFASGVEFFNPGTCGNRQVPDYPTFLSQNNTSGYPSSQLFLLLLLHLGCTNYHCVSAAGLG